MARKNTITITADDENNGDVFFCELREKFPSIAATLCTSGTCDVTREEWAAIQKLEGFADGPAHARHALVVMINGRYSNAEPASPEDIEA